MWILYVLDKVNWIRSNCSMSSDLLALVHINVFHRAPRLFYFQVGEFHFLLIQLCILNGLHKGWYEYRLSIIGFHTSWFLNGLFCNPISKTKSHWLPRMTPNVILLSFGLYVLCWHLWVFWLCVFKVAHPDGLLLTATAAARATRASARVRAALPSTSSPLPVPRPNRKPALRRKRSSCVRSPASPTSRLWTVQWRRVRPRFQGELICSAFEPPGRVTSWQGRGNRPRRRWRRSRSWRNASRTSGGFKFQSVFRRGRTCGSRSSWKNISSEMISFGLAEPISATQQSSQHIRWHHYSSLLGLIWLVCVTMR